MSTPVAKIDQRWSAEEVVEECGQAMCIARETRIVPVERTVFMKDNKTIRAA